MWRMSISPNHKEDDFKSRLSLADKIEIFRDRVDGWQLGIADQCINARTVDQGKPTPLIDHSGYAVLHIVMSYFEMIGVHEHGIVGGKKYSAYFENGFRSVFPPGTLSLKHTSEAKLIRALYRQVRSALYHYGITAPTIILTGDTQEPIADIRGYVIINPHLLVVHLRQHLQDYVDRLLDPGPANTQLRVNFEKRWDWQHSRDVRLIGE